MNCPNLPTTAILTEISVNGGGTWQPTGVPLHLRLLPAIRKIRTLNTTVPPESRFVPGVGTCGIECPPSTGSGAGRVTISSFNFMLRTPPALPAAGSIAVACAP